MKTKILALFLSLAMLFTCMPVSAFAKEGRTRDAVIAALAEEYGSEKAEQIFNTMSDMGIIDENGNRIIHKIEMDGKEYTLEQIKEIISSSDVDLSKEVKVDDDAITLAVINDMLKYEEFLNYVDKNFVNNDIELTDEHLAGLSSLENQIKTSGIGFQTMNTGITYENGYRHDVYVKATVSETTEGQVDFELYDGSGKLTEALSYDISFDYKTLDGSAKAGTQYTVETGTVTFEKNQTPVAKSISVSISDKTENNHADKRWNGEKTFFLYCYDIRNASFEGGNRTSCVALGVSKAYDYNDYKDDNLHNGSWLATLHLENKTTYLTCSMSDALKYAFEDGMIGGLKGVLSYDFDVTDSSVTAFYSNFINYFYVKSVQGNDIIRSEDENLSSWKVYYNQGSENIKFAKVEFATEFSSEQIAALQAGGTPMVSTYVDRVRLIGDMDFSVLTHNGVFFGNTNDRIREIYADSNKKETVKPEVDGVFATEETFISGDTIPVTVEFSEPIVVTSDIKLTVENGESTSELTPVDSEIDTISKYVTFLYTVPAQPALKIYATAVSGAKDIAGNEQTAFTADDESAPLAPTLELDNANSITDIELSPDTSLPKQNVDITVNLYTDAGPADQNAWLTSNTTPVDGNSYSTDKLYASIDGGTTIIPLVYTGEDTSKLTGNFVSPDNISTSDKIYQVELFMDISTNDTPNFVPIIGKKADLTVEPVVLADPDDIIFSYPPTPSGQEKTLYLGETINLSYSYNGNATYQTADDFAWSSSDVEVATIDSATGMIIPVGLGNVNFTLTNLNGGAGTITKTTDAYKVMAGGPPQISTGTVIAKWKEAAQILWSSSITYKNQNDVSPAVENTYYNISLYEGNYTKDNLPQTPLQTYQSLANASTFEIPTGILAVPSANAATPAYTVKISAVFEGVEYSALGHIMVSMPPATVAITRPQNYSVLDTQGGTTVTWNTNNIDETNGYSFKAEVVKNGVSIGTSTDINGSIQITYDDVTGKLKDVYTIKAQVKNNTDDTWSYDSYILNVYDAEALKIFVDGQNQNSITMSNRDEIKNLSSADIVALNRNIFLKNTLGINYKEYEYGAISDQIEWKSDDSSTASVNYERGGEYRNIEEYSQTSYMPNTDFILAGHNDGEATISATHKFTQMKRELGVTVEALKDRLYLFQFMPRAETTVTYKKSDGQIVTVTSDANGALAIYEEDGIQGDVKLRSELNGQVYLGTI